MLATRSASGPKDERSASAVGVKRRHEKIRVVVDILFFIESSGLKKSNLPPKCVHRRSRTLTFKLVPCMRTCNIGGCLGRTSRLVVGLR